LYFRAAEKLRVKNDIMLEDETKTCHPYVPQSTHHNMHVLQLVVCGCGGVGRTGAVNAIERDALGKWQMPRDSIDGRELLFGSSPRPVLQP
jgi:hypothetical protein